MALARSKSPRDEFSERRIVFGRDRKPLGDAAIHRQAGTQRCCYKRVALGKSAEKDQICQESVCQLGVGDPDELSKDLPLRVSSTAILELPISS